MSQRQHIPFDAFAMKVEVPVSLFVRDGALGWSCGQCPLDDQARVVSAHDPVAQAKHVCDMIRRSMARANFTSENLAKLHVYFVPTSPTVDAALISEFGTAFPACRTIVPIAVPHFYYDGMMIEVDVFAGSGLKTPPPPEHENKDLSIHVVEGADVIWVTARTTVDGSDALPACLRRIERGLADCGLSPAQLLCDHWIVPDSNKSHAALTDNAYVTLPGASVLQHDTATPCLQATFVFSRAPVALHMAHDPETHVTVARRISGRFVWAAGTCAAPTLGLLGQTDPIMKGLKTALNETGATFQDVTKLTAHYVGGASEDDLHGNMTIRHSYYGTPGPASTGLPVKGLVGRNCALSVDVFGARPDGTD